MRPWLLVIWGIVFSQGIRAQSGLFHERGTPFHKNYLPDEYDAGTQNWCAVQDRRGLMYFGNNSGVLQYDGVRWRLIPTANRTVARSLAIDRSGRVLVGAKGDFGYLSHDSLGAFSFVSLKSKVPPPAHDFSDVWDIVVDERRAYFCTFKYVFSWDGDSMKVIPPATSFHRAFRCRDKNYIMQVGVGLMELDSTGIRPAPGGDRFKDDRVFFIVPYGSDSLLLGSRTAGLWVSYQGRITPVGAAGDTSIRRHQMYHAVALRDGRFIVATLRKGIFVLDRQLRVTDVLNVKNGLTDDAIYRLYLDDTDGLWLSTNRGITRVGITLPLSEFDENDGLKGSVLAIVRHQGRLYTGTTQGLFVLQPSENEAVFMAVSEVRNQVWALYSDHDRLLIGTNDGAYQWSGGVLKKILSHITFTFLPSRFDTTVVFAGLQDGIGLLKRQRDGWVMTGRIEGAREEVRTLCESKEGGLWAGTSFQGVLYIAHPRSPRPEIQRYGSSEGLPVGFIRVYPTSVHPVFLSGKGLYALDAVNRRFVNDPFFGEQFTDSTKDIFLAGEDGRKRLWFFSGLQFFKSEPSEHGAYSVQPSALSSLAKAPMYSLFLESDGTMWIGGVGAVTRFEAYAQRRLDHAFESTIRSVKSGGRIAYGGDGPVFPAELEYHENALRFEYAASWFTRENETRFQCYLKGFEKTWSDWTEETKKDYTNLPEGRYEFRLRARNIYGTIGREAGFSLVIFPPWYRTWWAYIVYTMIALTGIYGAMQWRVWKLERDRAQLERIVAQRTAELREQAITLAELNEKKNEFLGIAVHDLRSPLNAIRGFVELIIDELKTRSLNERQALEDLQNVFEAADGMSQLINNLLDVSAIESGKLVLQRRECHLAPILDRCERFYANAASRKQIRLTVDRGPDPVVFADESKIGEVLDNLVSNAIKYTQPGGQVRVYLIVDNGEATTFVSDTGQGLSDEDQRELFVGFRRLSSRPTGGESSSGLGLAIVKKIVDMHGGRVQVRSEMGKGSTFSFSLPLLPINTTS